MEYTTNILPPTKEALRLAAGALRRGELVGMPTETVYGLAANAYDPSAVEKIFLAKGRPQDNPLIVHIADLASLDGIASGIGKTAELLASRFWPGPFTMILPKSEKIPDCVTAGLDSVAVRMPSHPVAAALIRESGLPLAAPSANLSGRPSTTEARHVYDDLHGKIPYIIDGGSCDIGVESTVVKVMDNKVLLLRPGAVTVENMRELGIEIEIARAVETPLKEGETVLSPGMKYKHYAPKAKVVIVDGPIERFASYVRFHSDGHTYALVFEGEEASIPVPTLSFGHSDNSLEQASHLFTALRAADEKGASCVYCRCPSKQGVGLAVYNRLLRAAGFEVVVL